LAGGKRQYRVKHAGRRPAQGQWPLPPAESAPAAVSISDAAHYLGVHLSTLKRWMANGRIAAEPAEKPATIAMTEVIRLRELLQAERS